MLALPYAIQANLALTEGWKAKALSTSADDDLHTSMEMVQLLRVRSVPTVPSTAVQVGFVHSKTCAVKVTAADRIKRLQFRTPMVLLKIVSTGHCGASLVGQISEVCQSCSLISSYVCTLVQELSFQVFQGLFGGVCSFHA